jgi:Xaa-Pro aminopeptidase
MTLAPTPVNVERERRHAALQELLAELDLDALVLCANDYRGHKGTLRWVADYNIVHRYGFAIAAPGRDPELLLPENLAMGPPGSWDVVARYARRMGPGLVDALRELGTPKRIGIIGLGEVMKVADYLALRAGFPEAELVDAGDAFEHVRARKTDEDLGGVHEATRIAEACFERLLEVTRPGMTEREVGAAMYERCYALGGEDPLFLTMYAVDGRGQFGSPADRVLDPGTQLIFSFELIGPRGYWMELARMVTLGKPTALQRRLNEAVRAGMEAGAEAMLPGVAPESVQRAVIDAVAEHGCRSTYWSGHGIGQDVIEEPWLGLEVVQDRDVPAGWTVEPGMALALHPYVVDLEGKGIGYMANTYLTGDGPAEPVSRVSLNLHVIA